MGREFRALNSPQSSPLNQVGFSLHRMAMLLKDRIRVILDDQGINKKALADIARVSKGNVTHWSDGTATTMKYEAAIEIHRKFKYSIRWLMHGVGDRFDNDSPDIDPIHENVLSLWNALVPSQQDEVLRIMQEKREQNDALKEQLAQSSKPPRPPSLSRGKHVQGKA